jgi:hypothetical protein
MSYSFDTKTDKWETLADTFDEYLNELRELDEDEDVFIPVADFDEDEVL